MKHFFVYGKMDDLCLTNVFKYINCGRDYKAVCLVSRDWYRVIYEVHIGGRDFMNDMVMITQMYPDADWINKCRPLSSMCFECINFKRGKWNWRSLSYYKKLSYEFIKSHPEYDWEYERICWNKLIPWDKIVELCGDNINYRGMSKRDDIDWNFVEKNLDKEWNWEELTVRANMQLILDHPNFPWDAYTVSHNIVDAETLDKLPSELLNINGIHQNKHIWDMMRKYPNFGWVIDKINWYRITYDLIKEFPQLLQYTRIKDYVSDYRIAIENPYMEWNWDWVLGSAPPDVIRDNLYKCSPDFYINIIKFTLEDVKQNLDLPWTSKWTEDFHNTVDKFPEIVSRHLRDNSIDMWDYVHNGVSKMYRKFPDAAWNHKKLSETGKYKVCLCLDFDIIKENPDKPWNWRWLSHVLDCKIILANTNLPWVWREVSENSTLKWYMVRDNPTLPWAFKK